MEIKGARTLLQLPESGIKLWRAQPTTFDRSINALYRGGIVPNGEDRTRPPLQVSNGAGVIVVVQGSVELRILGPNGEEEIEIHEGGVAGYRLSWPHRVIPQSPNTLTFDLCASKRGLPVEYLLRNYTYLKDYPDDESGVDGPRHLLAHAIESSGLDHEELAHLVALSSVLKGGRVRVTKAVIEDLLHGKQALDFDTIAEFAHVLRIPEEHFFRTLKAHRDTATTDVFYPLRGDFSFEVGDRGFEQARHLFFPPTEIFGRASELDVRILKVEGPVGSKEAIVQPDPEQACERLLLVLRGQLGVRLFGGHSGAGFCDGELDQGDVLWWRPDQLAYGFYLKDATRGSALLLDVRYPYPSGRTVAWGQPDSRPEGRERRLAEYETTPQAPPRPVDQFFDSRRVQ